MSPSAPWWRTGSPSDAAPRPARRGEQWGFPVPKVHPAEISKECLETLGFRVAGGHLLYTARARSD